MSKVDWSLAPNWCKGYGLVGISKFAVWFDDFQYQYLGDGKKHEFEGGCTFKFSELSDIEWRPQPKPWSGPEDGLPPVGVACERRFPSVTASSWQGGIILAHGSKKIFFRDNCGDEWAHSFDDVEFRAFRTTAQISADQRETAIRELMDIAQVDCRVTAARLVDAGFKREVV